MKSNSFLKSCMAIGAVLTAPVSAFAKFNRKNGIDKGVLVRAVFCPRRVKHALLKQARVIQS